MPSLPTVTAVNWTTMASGVHCGTHGRPYSARKLRYFWEAAVDAGIPVGLANIEHNDLEGGLFYVGHSAVLTGPTFSEILPGKVVDLAIASTEGAELARVELQLGEELEVTFNDRKTLRLQPGDPGMSERFVFAGADQDRTPLCTSVRQLPGSSSVYISPLRKAGGFCQPPDLEKRILEIAGPPPVRGFPLFHRREADLETSLDEEMYHARWFGQVAAGLMGGYEDALWFHRHNTTDGIGHYYLGLVDEGAYCYDPGNPKGNWEAIRRWYQTVEMVLGTILDVDPQARCAMCTDHGHYGYRRLLSLPKVLADRGLVEADPERPMAIDRKRSKVLIMAEEIFVNLDSREPPGPVSRGQYEETRDGVIEALRELVDPLDGTHPVAMVLKREEGQALQFWGPDRGDLLFLLKGGYFATPMIADDVYRQFSMPSTSSVHHGSVPGYETDVGSSFSFMALAGGSGERDIARLGIPHLVDFGPTVLAMLGLRPPEWLEGRVLWQMIGTEAPGDASG